jgi:hypothetical protein
LFKKDYTIGEDKRILKGAQMKKVPSKNKKVKLPIRIYGQPLPLVKGEPLAEGLVVEPHADYGLLNEETTEENKTK